MKTRHFLFFIIVSLAVLLCTSCEVWSIISDLDDPEEYYFNVTFFSSDTKYFALGIKYSDSSYSTTSDWVVSNGWDSESLRLEVGSYYILMDEDSNHAEFTQLGSKKFYGNRTYNVCYDSTTGTFTVTEE